MLFYNAKKYISIFYIVKNGRPTKKEMYEEERENLIQELNKIIGIDENNNYVYKCEIETNKEFENYIKEHMIEIRRMLLHNAKKYICIF